MDSLSYSEQAKGSTRKKLIQRFNRAILLAYITTVVLISILIGLWSRHEVYTAAGKELSLLVDVFKSVGSYVLEDVRPDLVAQDIFHAPALSPVVATRKISGHLLKVKPDYYVKTTSDNPLNPNNYPAAIEQEIIQKFRNDSDLKILIQEGTIQGRRYLTSSQPSVSKASCLECHGKIEQAPPQILEEYGSESGFNYPASEVVGANIVGVPLTGLQSIIVKRSIIAITVITMLFAGIFVIINKLIEHLILKPVVNITAMALDVSSGNLEREIRVDRNDEIGELANSFELVRRSLLTATKLLYKQRQQRESS